MKCPLCGATEKQERLGELADRPHIIYRCDICHQLYALNKEHEDSGDTDRE